MRLNKNKSNIKSKTTVFATYCIIGDVYRAVAPCPSHNAFTTIALARAKAHHYLYLYSYIIEVNVKDLNSGKCKREWDYCRLRDNRPTN